jgi:hypothetical protein
MCNDVSFFVKKNIKKKQKNKKTKIILNTFINKKILRYIWKKSISILKE